MTEATNLWPLRLLALIIAIVSWTLASYLPRLDELSSPQRTRTVSASVNYDIPAGFLILDPEPTVEVLVRGSREAVTDLNPFQVAVEVQLDDVRPGTVDRPLGPQNVSLPDGLEVVSLRPDRLVLRIDREDRRLMEVQVVFTGEPAAGYQPERPATVVPNRVEVRGPASHLESLGKVVAQVSLDGRALDFDQEVPVRSPDPLVQIVKPRVVTVYVTMRAPGVPPNGDTEATASGSR